MTAPVALAFALVAVLAATVILIGKCRPVSRPPTGCALEDLLDQPAEPAPDLFAPKTAPLPDDLNPAMWQARRMAWATYQRDALARAHRMANQPWGDQCE